MTRCLLVTTLLAAPLLSVSGQSMHELQEWMTGSFSSAAQAREDSSYFDIRLEMVPIWTDREDGPWLYVEQAAATNLERPYRQRVYQLSVDRDGRYRSEVFTLPDPLRFAGAWRSEDALASLTPDSLEVRRGCAVLLTGSGGQYAGSTVEDQCESNLRGASYATSEVTVSEDRIVSWDRGFDGSATQVWGAEGGPYVFLRTEPD